MIKKTQLIWFVQAKRLIDNGKIKYFNGSLRNEENGEAEVGEMKPRVRGGDVLRQDVGKLNRDVSYFRACIDGKKTCASCEVYRVCSRVRM